MIDGGRAPTASSIGLAFQIVDDILDVEGASADLGKTAGKDAAAGKPTYPALYGLENRGGWRRRASTRRGRTLERGPASADSCAAIARWVVARTPLKNTTRLDVLARRTRPRRVARAGARADPRRPGPRRRLSRSPRPGPAFAPTPTSTVDGPIIRTSAAAASSSRTRSTPSASTSTGRARARHRRLDRRLHRRAAAARRAARRRARRRPRPARLEAAQRSARGRHRARQRAHADRRPTSARRARLRHRHHRRVVHLAAARSSRSSRRCSTPAATSSRSSSRSSRPAATKSARAASCATTPCSSGSSTKWRSRQLALGLERSRHGRIADSPAWKATASSCCT